MLTFQKFTKKILEIYVKKIELREWLIGTTVQMSLQETSACESKWTIGLWKQIYHRLVGANIPSACGSKYTIGLWEQIYHRLEGANVRVPYWLVGANLDLLKRHAEENTYWALTAQPQRLTGSIENNNRKNINNGNPHNKYNLDFFFWLTRLGLGG